MSKPGHRLRVLREQLGFTLRDVESATHRIAARHKNGDYVIPLSRLSEIENKGLIPSVYRLYSLAVTYRRDFRELLSWYGIDLDSKADDLALAQPPHSHLTGPATGAMTAALATVDSGFDPSRTTKIGQIVAQWGIVPLAYLAQLPEDYVYAYIGSHDFSMYPLIMPGSFLQVDTNRNRVTDGEWRSEYERPIYFLETRDGYTCCWCSVYGERLILQPHPLSRTTPRSLKQPQEVEVVGQVVGLAMRIGECMQPRSSPA